MSTHIKTIETQGKLDVSDIKQGVYYKASNSGIVFLGMPEGKVLLFESNYTPAKLTLKEKEYFTGSHFREFTGKIEINVN